MRLGLHDTMFQPGSESSTIRALYGGSDRAHERHRHRYEVNPQYVEKLQAAGLHFVGKDTTGQRMEIFELQDHPFFIGKFEGANRLRWGFGLTVRQERNTTLNIRAGFFQAAYVHYCFPLLCMHGI